MAERKPAKKSTQKSTKRTTDKPSKEFTAEEKAAMREAVRERKSPGGEKEVLAKIAEMPKADRVLAERVHAIVKAAAPDLAPRTWYGMPAYAKDDKVAERPDEPLRLRTGSLEGDARCFEATLRRRQKTCPGLGRRPDR
jgi:hypothetical protein